MAVRSNAMSICAKVIVIVAMVDGHRVVGIEGKISINLMGAIDGVHIRGAIRYCRIMVMLPTGISRCIASMRPAQIDLIGIWEILLDEYPRA